MRSLIKTLDWSDRITLAVAFGALLLTLALRVTGSL